MLRRLGQQRLVIALGVGVLLGALWWASSSTDNFCDELVHLQDESQTGFRRLRGTLVDEPAGEWSTTFEVSSTDYCSIIDDPERVSYGCEWSHDTQTEAQLAHSDRVERVARCLGQNLDGRQDSAVNHPDYWASTTFPIPGGDVSVSLKTKNSLSQVFVSLQVTQEKA